MSCVLTQLPNFSVSEICYSEPLKCWQFIQWTFCSRMDYIPIDGCIFGASLRNPHTSVTALSMCVNLSMFVCLFVCLFVWTDHLLQISSRRLILHTSREQLSECSVVGNPERRRLKLKHAGSLYVCVCVCFYKLSQLRTMQTNFTANYLWTVMTHSGWSCFSYLRHSRDSAHDLFSPCMCSHSSCPDWQRTVTNPVAIYVLCAMTIAITMCCLLRLAPWCWSIFLYAVVVPLVFALDFSGVPLYYSTIPFTSYNRWIECLVSGQQDMDTSYI